MCRMLLFEACRFKDIALYKSYQKFTFRVSREFMQQNDMFDLLFHNTQGYIKIDFTE